MNSIPPDEHQCMMQWRRDSVNQVIGSWALEGLSLSKEMLADTELYIQGELTVEELVKRSISRHMQC